MSESVLLGIYLVFLTYRELFRSLKLVVISSLIFQHELFVPKE